MTAESLQTSVVHPHRRPALLSRRISRAVVYRIATDGIPVLLVLLWYFASFNTPEYILPNPIKVLGRTWELLIGNPSLFQHTWVSMARILTAVVVALVVGTSLALLGRYVWVVRGLIVDRILPFYNAFPSLGWAILGLFWLGVSDAAVIFVEASILLPFVIITVWEGLKTLDAETMEMAYSFTRSRPRLLFKIVLPLLLPYEFAAMRASYGLAWKVALLAELFGNPIGLGYLLNYSRTQFDSSIPFAAILVLITLVYAIDKLVFAPIERKLMPHLQVGSARA